MGKGLKPTITPVGVIAAAPFAPGQYTVVSVSNPPTIFGGRLHQAADAVLSITAPDVSGAVQTFVFGAGSSGGLSKKTVLLGDNIKTNGLAGSDRHVSIGGNINFAAALGGDADRIMIGWDFAIGTPTNTGALVLIGSSITTTLAVGAAVGIGNNLILTGGDSVALGDSVQVTGESTAAGKAAQANGAAACAYGKQARANGVRAIAMGQLARADLDNQICLGPNINSSTFANAVIIGRSSEVFEVNAWGLGGDQVNGTEMRVLRLGPNTLAGYAGLSVFLPSAAAGNNVLGPPTTIRGGISTGSAAAGGKLTLQTSLIGAGGGAYQGVIDVFRIQSGGTIGNPTIAFLNQISTVGVQAGTFANVPGAAGPKNPAGYMEFFFNGVLSYLPFFQ